MVGIKHIFIYEATIIDGRGVAIEEGIVNGKACVVVEAYERVDVDREWGPVVVQELNDLQHRVTDVSSEVAS